MSIMIRYRLQRLANNFIPDEEICIKCSRWEDYCSTYHNQNTDDPAIPEVCVPCSFLLEQMVSRDEVIKKELKELVKEIEETENE